MRIPRASAYRPLLFLCILAQVALSRKSSAQASTDAPVPSSNPIASAALSREESLRHFDSGLRLYEDKNYSGALAEFEAAQQIYPSAASLQNVALCQKQLYRYSDARETLKQLLLLQGSTLSADEAETVQKTINELARLVGSIRLSVSPKNANVTVDGRSLEPRELEQSISFDVGEHRVTVEADGFAPLTKTFRVSGGSYDMPLEIALAETTGLVEIVAPNAQTAIAVDGHPVAFSSYIGRLTPGSHFVQIYRDGYEPYEEELNVKIGDKLRIVGELGEPTETVVSGSNSSSHTPHRRVLYGFYGLGSASLLAVRGHPSNFVANSNYDFGYELGLRAGYRFITPFGIEAQLSSGSFVVQGHCRATDATSCRSSDEKAYRLDTRRLGLGMRLMSQGEKLRFYSVVSSGLVAQDLQFFGERASATSPYVGVEIGAERNYAHLIIALSLMGVFDGAANVTGRKAPLYADGSGVQFLGLGLRIGYSDWAEPRKVPPLPPHVSPSTQRPSAPSAPPLSR